jgi:hypothetical protein
MHQRKLPLVIHIDPIVTLALNKTCRYCPRCDLLIAHQNDLEHLLASIFSEHNPEIVGNAYVVLGTVDRDVWKSGTKEQGTEQGTVQNVLSVLHDFKEVVTFKVTGGWMKDERKSRPGK